MKRRTASATAALLLLSGLVPDVYAGEEWCEEDPVVAIVTPKGAVVSVFVTNGVKGPEHQLAAILAKIKYSVKSIDGGRATRVTMLVTVPADAFEDRFETRSVVSTGPLKSGVILGSALGFSGQSMEMMFKLDVP